MKTSHATRPRAFRHESPKARKQEQACRNCGCTEQQGCPGGCSWIEPDLCSACITTSLPYWIGQRFGLAELLEDFSLRNTAVSRAVRQVIEAKLAVVDRLAAEALGDSACYITGDEPEPPPVSFGKGVRTSDRIGGES